MFAGSGGSLPDGDVDYAFYGGSDTINDSFVLPPTDQWTQFKTIDLSGWKIHGVRLWFSQGCRNKVQIRIHYNGSPWLPESPYSDYYVGDDLLLYIPVDRVISDNDKVDVYYWNKDRSDHLIEVKFDMVREREWETRTPLDVMVESGRGNMPSYSQSSGQRWLEGEQGYVTARAVASAVVPSEGKVPLRGLGEPDMESGLWPKTNWLANVGKPGSVLRTIGRLGGLFR